MAEVGFAGSQGGLQTIRSAQFSGNKSIDWMSTALSRPRRSRFAVAQAIALGLVSVAMMSGMPRLARIAAITPEPVPMSKAV